MAPERLMTAPMLVALGRLPVTLFAIDEAHCISQWGLAFRPEYEDLCRLRELFPGVPIAALTATADEVTREDMAKRLFGGAVEPFILGFDRPNIKLSVEMKRDWKRQLRSFIARHEGECGIFMTDPGVVIVASGSGWAEGTLFPWGAGDIGEITDAELLREVMNTVGKKDRLGEQIRCVAHHC